MLGFNEGWQGQDGEEKNFCPPDVCHFIRNSTPSYHGVVLARWSREALVDWRRLGEVDGGSLIKAHADWSGCPVMGREGLRD